MKANKLISALRKRCNGAAARTTGEEKVDANKRLWNAVCCNDATTVAEVLKHNADTCTNNDFSLILAVIRGYTEVTKLLLDYGADVHVMDGFSLNHAAKNGYTGIVRVLLAHGADVHAWDDYALVCAAENGHAEVVRLLLEHGAGAHGRASAALRAATENGHIEVMKILQKRMKIKPMKEIKVTSAPCGEMYDNLCALAEYYGLELQICKTLEELGELSAALARRQLDQNYSGVLEEIADVYNMLDQLCILLDCEDKVADIAESKILRQLKRIENEQGASGEECSAQ